jgi:hypothetical protein
MNSYLGIIQVLYLYDIIFRFHVKIFSSKPKDKEQRTKNKNKQQMKITNKKIKLDNF